MWRSLVWRFQKLVDLGFEPDQALRLAGQASVDCHVVAGLVSRGCPPRALRFGSCRPHPHRASVSPKFEVVRGGARGSNLTTLVVNGRERPTEALR